MPDDRLLSKPEDVVEIKHVSPPNAYGDGSHRNMSSIHSKVGCGARRPILAETKGPLSLGEPTFHGTHGNGRDAPKPDDGRLR